MSRPRRSSPKILHRAGELRHEPTPAEAKLWAYLRTLREENIHFRKQHAIGPYIADFCAPRRKLIVELDGSQHLEQTEYDAERTKYLESQGYKVIRFWNDQVMNDIEGVIKAIIYELASYRLRPGSRPNGGSVSVREIRFASFALFAEFALKSWILRRPSALQRGELTATTCGGIR